MNRQALLSPAPKVRLVAEGFERALRAADLTKGTFCRRRALHPSLLSHYLAGRRLVDRDEAVLMAVELGVPMAEIAEDVHARCPKCGTAVAA